MIGRHQLADLLLVWADELGMTIAGQSVACHTELF